MPLMRRERSIRDSLIRQDGMNERHDLIVGHRQYQAQSSAFLGDQFSIHLRLDRSNHDAIRVHEAEDHRTAAVFPVEQFGQLRPARELDQETNAPAGRIGGRFDELEWFLPEAIKVPFHRFPRWLTRRLIGSCRCHRARDCPRNDKPNRQPGNAVKGHSDLLQFEVSSSAGSIKAKGAPGKMRDVNSLPASAFSIE
jgi:hypothetical protein